MTQEELLDQIAQLIDAEAKNGPGTIAVIYDDEFRVRRIVPAFKDGTELIRIINVPETGLNLPPSDYLRIAKPLWNIYSTKPHTTKFPGRPPKGDKPDDPKNRNPNAG